MARSNYSAVMDEILRHEGGFVDHPRDPGGATNMGITIGTLRGWRGKPVTREDVRALTEEEARVIYQTRYWNPVRGDDLPHGIDLVAMDGGVNSGVSRGSQWLQRALGVSTDGKIGPVSVKAAQAADPVPVIQKACAVRMGFLRGLRTWDAFGRGWSRRVASVEAVAVRMAIEAKGQPARAVLMAEKETALTKAKREQKAAAGTVATGASSGGSALVLSDAPNWGLIGLGVVVLVIMVVLIGRSRTDQDRAEAYQQAAEEAIS